MTANPARNFLLPTLAIAAGVVALDQFTKWLALSFLADGQRVAVFGDYFGFKLLRNPGAALGLGYGYTGLLTLVVIAVIIIIVRVIRRVRSWIWAIALGLLLGGAIGNLIDRLFRAPGFGEGHVIDFIAYWDWFVGNVADIAIVGAAATVVVLSFAGIGLDGNKVDPSSNSKSGLGK